MNQKKTAAARWLDTAVARVMFPPDRAAVRRELAEHLEDKTLDLMRIFPELDREEAHRRAVEGMGDPEEVGRALARIHSPVLGVVWYACRGLLAASALLFLFFVLLQPRFVDGLRDGNWEVERLDVVYRGQQELGDWIPPPATELKDHRVEVLRAARMRESWYDEDGGDEWSCESVALTLRVTAHAPWDRPAEELTALERGLTAVDSGGRETRFPRVEGDGFGLFRDEQPVRPGRQGWDWRQYELIARDITPGAEELTLFFRFGGQDFTIRVPLPGEVTYYKIVPASKEEFPWELR